MQLAEPLRVAGLYNSWDFFSPAGYEKDACHFYLNSIVTSKLQFKFPKSLFIVLSAESFLHFLYF
jgi:hypothetical protein